MKASSDREQAGPGFGWGSASLFSALNRVFLCMFLAGVVIPVAVADFQVVEGTRYADQIDGVFPAFRSRSLQRAGLTMSVARSLPRLTMEPGSGNDVVSAGGGDDVLVFSGASLGVDVVAGGEGYDRIVGGGGDDIIGFNRVYGGNEAVEEIDGGAGYNVIEGGRYSDDLNFSQTLLINIAAISGLRGADTIAGSQAADVIEGGAGNDTLYGRAGDDTFLIFGEGNDFDLVRGDEGIDRILGSPGDDVIGLRGYSGSNSVEIIDGGGGNNTIQGTAFADFLDFQNTTLLSIAMIDGGDGSDSIVGSQGDDVIDGGKGNDTVDGGYGFDTAVFPGPQSDYEIFFGNSSTTVIKVSSSGANESDVLIAVEQMRFSDGIVTIGDDNRPPTVVDDVLDAIEDTVAVYLPIDLTGNDTDPDGDPLEIVSVDAVSGGDVRLQSNGNVRFQPDANFSGYARFSYVVEDDMQAGSSGSVTVRVAPVNDPPVASDDAFLTGVDTELVMQPGALLANDTDVDTDDRLAIVRVDNAVNGTARLLADGAIAFMPDAGFIGQGRMRYLVEDQDGGG